MKLKNMRKLIYPILVVVATFLMAACSNGAKNSDGESSQDAALSKEISPENTDFTLGQLARYVRLVDEPCEMSFSVKEGVFESQTIRLKTHLELVKEGIKAEDYRDIDFTSLLSVAIVEILDKQGTKINDLDISSHSIPKLKKLLLSSPGTKEEIIFEGTFHNSEDAPKWFENTVSFIPTLSADIVINNDEEIASEENSEESEENSEETVSESNEENTTSASVDVDELLDEYENYVDKYVSLAKKIANGDLTVMGEYTSYMQQAQKLMEKLDAVNGEISSSQLVRYNEINMKMANAAANM